MSDLVEFLVKASLDLSTMHAGADAPLEYERREWAESLAREIAALETEPRGNYKLTAHERDVVLGWAQVAQQEHGFDANEHAVARRLGARAEGTELYDYIDFDPAGDAS